MNGFSFYNSEKSLLGVQNQIFSIFLIFLLHNNSVQLFIPRFLEHRDIYEIREQPSRTYSWVVFILSNIIAELPSQVILAVFQYLAWYYPTGMFRNAQLTDELSSRGGLVFLVILSFFIFSSTFSQMIATIMPDAATGINVSSLFFSLSLIFCGQVLLKSYLHFSN